MGAAYVRIMRPHRPSAGGAIAGSALLALTAFAFLAPDAAAAGWQSLSIPHQSAVTAVQASDTVAGLAWGNGELSRDGGRTWAASATAVGAIVPDARAATWWSFHDTSLVRSDNSGATWQSVPGLETAAAAAAEAIKSRSISVPQAGIDQLLADPLHTSVLWAIV